MLPQRYICYSTVPDLREVIHPGDIKKAVVKKFDKDAGILKLSLKEATPHPFDGIETRHPVKATRIAKIVEKYKGGVFCKLHDGITDVLCSYLSMEYDGDYKIGDTVEIVIKKYNYERKNCLRKNNKKMNVKN